MKLQQLKNLKIYNTLFKVFGGLGNKDWKETSISTICLICIIGNIITILVTKLYSQIYCPLLWMVLFIFIKSNINFKYLILSFLLALFCIITNPVQYAGITIFILLILKLSNNNKQRIVLITNLFIISTVKGALTELNIVYIFTIIVQYSFSLFVYYGFFYTPCCNKECKAIFATEKEKIVLDAMIENDLDKRETAHMLNMNYNTFMGRLKTCRERNGYRINECLVRDYALQKTKTSHSENE